MIQTDIPNIESKKKLLIQPVQAKNLVSTSLRPCNVVKCLQRNLVYRRYINMSKTQPFGQEKNQLRETNRLTSSTFLSCASILLTSKNIPSYAELFVFFPMASPEYLDFKPCIVFSISEKSSFHSARTFKHRSMLG